MNVFIGVLLIPWCFIEVWGSFAASFVYTFLVGDLWTACMWFCRWGFDGKIFLQMLQTPLFCRCAVSRCKRKAGRVSKTIEQWQVNLWASLCCLQFMCAWSCDKSVHLWVQVVHIQRFWLKLVSSTSFFGTISFASGVFFSSKTSGFLRARGWAGTFSTVAMQTFLIWMFLFFCRSSTNERFFPAIGMIESEGGEMAFAENCSPFRIFKIFCMSLMDSIVKTSFLMFW